MDSPLGGLLAVIIMSIAILMMVGVSQKSTIAFWQKILRRIFNFLVIQPIRWCLQQIRNGLVGLFRAIGRGIWALIRMGARAGWDGLVDLYNGPNAPPRPARLVPRPPNRRNRRRP